MITCIQQCPTGLGSGGRRILPVRPADLTQPGLGTQADSAGRYPRVHVLDANLKDPRTRNGDNLSSVAVPSVFRHQLSSGSSFFWRSFVTVYSGSSFSLSLLVLVSDPSFCRYFPIYFFALHYDFHPWPPFWLSLLINVLVFLPGYPFWRSFLIALSDVHS